MVARLHLQEMSPCTNCALKELFISFLAESGSETGYKVHIEVPVAGVTDLSSSSEKEAKATQMVWVECMAAETTTKIAYER